MASPWLGGVNDFGQTKVPPLPPGLTYVEISAGQFHVLGLRSDGSVVAWGKISAGNWDSVAVRSDGSLINWGLTSNEISQAGPGVAIQQVEASVNFNLALSARIPICQPDLGSQGPGQATASFCGEGLSVDEGSIYRVTGAPANAAGICAVSLYGFPIAALGRNQGLHVGAAPTRWAQSRLLLGFLHQPWHPQFREILAGRKHLNR